MGGGGGGCRGSSFLDHFFLPSMLCTSSWLAPPPFAGVIHDQRVGTHVQDHRSRVCPLPSRRHDATDTGSQSQARDCIC